MPVLLPIGSGLIDVVLITPIALISPPRISAAPVYNKNSSVSFQIEKDKLSCWNFVKSGTYIFWLISPNNTKIGSCMTSWGFWWCKSRSTGVANNMSFQSKHCSERQLLCSPAGRAMLMAIWISELAMAKVTLCALDQGQHDEKGTSLGCDFTFSCELAPASTDMWPYIRGCICYNLPQNICTKWP